MAIDKSNPLYDAVKKRNERQGTPGLGIKDSGGDDDDDTGGSSSSSSSGSSGSSSSSSSSSGSSGSSSSSSSSGSNSNLSDSPVSTNSGSSGSSDSSSDSGTGPKPDSAVRPDNPLYDAVKAGGGYYEDEDGNVKGGPDGDGTIRTKEERMGDNSSSGTDSSSRSSADPQQATDPTTKTESGLNADNDSSTGTNDGQTLTGDTDPREGLTGEQILYGQGSQITNSNADQFDLVDGQVVREEAVKDVQTAALGNLNEATGGEGQGFQPEDITVTTAQRDGQTFLTAELNESGQQKFGEEQERIVTSNAAQKIQSQTEASLRQGEDFTVSFEDGSASAQLTDQGLRQEAAAQSDQFSADDFLVNNDGEVSLSIQAQKEAIAAERDGVSADDITVQQTRTDAPETFGEANAAINADGPTGGVQTQFTFTGQQDVTVDGQGTERDLFSGVVSGTEDALSEVAQLASGDESTTVEFRGEGSVIQDASEVAPSGDGEQFGDFKATIPFTDTEVDDGARAVGQAFNDNVAQPVGQVTGDVLDVSQSGIQNAVTIFSGQGPDQLSDREADAERLRDIVRGQQQDQSTERVLETFGEGAGSGAVNTANIPALAATGIEAAEFGVEGASRTADGEGGEFARQAAAAGVLTGAQVAQSAQENPVSFAGQVAGSTVASVGILGTAQRVGGPRASRAASFGIQPGEELLLSAARRSVPGTRRLNSAFGDISPEATTTVSSGQTTSASGTTQTTTSAGGSSILDRIRRDSTDTDTETDTETETDSESRPLTDEEIRNDDRFTFTPEQLRGESVTDGPTDNPLQQAPESDTEADAEAEGDVDADSGAEQEAAEESSSNIREFLTDDNRGQLDLTFGRSRGEGSSDSDDGLSLTDELQEDLQRMVRAEQTREANKRAEERVRESQERLRREEELTEVEFEPSSPGGRSVTSRQTRTANPGRNAGQGPTASQQAAFRTGRDIEPPRRDPRPLMDLRQNDQARRIPDQDLREQAEARQVTESNAVFGSIENTAVSLVRGSEANVGLDTISQTESRLNEAQSPSTTLGVGPDIDDLLGTDINARADTRPDIGLDIGPRFEVDIRGEGRQETRQETRQELRQETRQETRQELRQETRQETRSEARAETRQEARSEANIFDRDTKRGRNSRGFGALFDDDAEAILTDFRNPLTGELLQTDIDE